MGWQRGPCGINHVVLKDERGRELESRFLPNPDAVARFLANAGQPDHGSLGDVIRTRREARRDAQQSVNRRAFPYAR